jgi:SAM-dependent methyltransferase
MLADQMFESIRCPICDHDDFEPVRGARHDAYIEAISGRSASTWAICRTCTLVMQNPRPSAEGLAELYSASTYHGESLADSAAALSYAAIRPRPFLPYLAELLPRELLQRERRVLDVGCGFGGAMLVFEMEGWDAIGIQPDPRLAEIGRRFGLDIRTGFFGDDECHSFEHFLDPMRVALAARKVLHDPGYLFVAVPTFRRSRVPGREWMNASHTFMFTAETLGNLLRRAGFAVVDSRYQAADGELWLLATTNDHASEAGSLPYRDSLRRVERELDLTMRLRGAAWAVPRVVARQAQYLPSLMLDPAGFLSGVRRRVARVRRR